MTSIPPKEGKKLHTLSPNNKTTTTKSQNSTRLQRACSPPALRCPLQRAGPWRLPPGRSPGPRGGRLSPGLLLLLRRQQEQLPLLLPRSLPPLPPLRRLPPPPLPKKPQRLPLPPFPPPSRTAPTVGSRARTGTGGSRPALGSAAALRCLSRRRGRCCTGSGVTCLIRTGRAWIPVV